jgi:hypothetical protein
VGHRDPPARVGVPFSPDLGSYIIIQGETRYAILEIPFDPYVQAIPGCHIRRHETKPFQLRTDWIRHPETGLGATPSTVGSLLCPLHLYGEPGWGTCSLLLGSYSAVLWMRHSDRTLGDSIKYLCIYEPQFPHLWNWWYFLVCLHPWIVKIKWDNTFAHAYSISFCWVHTYIYQALELQREVRDTLCPKVLTVEWGR